MRHNKELQRIADEYAWSCGKAAASYLGRIGEMFVYSPVNYDTIPRCEGYPMLILVENGKAESIIDRGSFDIMDKLRRRDLSKGRRLFREYESMVSSGKKVPSWARDLVSVGSEYSYDCTVEKQLIYEYLEVADRLNMKVLVKADPETMTRLDGWEYYLELKKNRL